MRVVLFAHPRSGTTYLRSLLNQHPSVYFYGEVFHPDIFSWGFYSYLKTNIKDIYNLHSYRDHIVPFFDSLTGIMEDAGKKIIGFDVKTPQFSSIMDGHGAIVEKDFFIIHLTRNYLDAYTSYEIMQERNRKSIPAHNSFTPNPQKVFLDINILLPQLKLMKAQDDLIEGTYKNKNNYIKIDYNDITPNIIQNLFGQFGIEVITLKDSTLVKQNSELLTEKILNIEEVFKCLLNTEFEIKPPTVKKE